MKSGEPVKETPVEREASGRRPKRKCLQWHPLLSKKVLDISEEEEQEVEEGHKGALLICEKSQCQKVECGGTEEEEEVLSEQRARRPMNAFLLFCKRHRSLVRREHPRLDNRGATKTLADWWAVLEPTEKQKYTDMAKEYKDAFLKANPGYKWCPPTNKPAKNSLPNASTQKKLWLFPTEPSKDCVFAKEVPKTDSTPQLNFAMADPTNMGGLSMLLLAGEHALTARERVFSSSSYSSMPEGKQSGQSALFQLAEMCLASEAGKIESLTPQQEEYSSTTNSTERGTSDQVINSQGTPILPVSSLSSPFSASTSSASGSPSVLSQSNTQRKKKRRRKDKAMASTFDSKLAGLSKKTSKRCHSPESDPESIILNTEAMAKGYLNVEEDKEGMPKKKEHQAECKKSCLEGTSSLRKPPKLKESPMGRKEKEQPVNSKPLSLGVHSPKREMEKPILKTDPPLNPEDPLVSLSHTSLPIKTEEKTKAKADTVGSRKSERTCKGALYKTLVLEGMLTSLRASVDRGKRGSGRGTAPDIEGSWTKESWAFAQTGASNKKLKKSRSKDESIPSLGVLEEEFEKKFNSLPRYSPLTFDKKATENGTVDQPKGSSPSQKKNLFHKIVSKHKHKREKPKTLDKVIQNPTVLGTVQEFSRSAPCGVLCLEMLVGSQKRKARKRKITHLVRTADGNVSAAGVEEKTKQIQDQDAKPLPQKTEGNKDCFAESGTQGACIVTTDKTGTSGLPAFLSLAALAEVAAMEIPNRGHYPVSVSCEGQSKEVVQKAVLISCADQ